MNALDTASNCKDQWEWNTNQTSSIGLELIIFSAQKSFLNAHFFDKWLTMSDGLNTGSPLLATDLNVHWRLALEAIEKRWKVRKR